MTAAKKTKTAAKKNNDSSNYQTNGGNIGPSGPWAPPLPGPFLGPPFLGPSGSPWALPGPPSLSPLGLPWVSLGLPWAPLPIRPSPKAAEGVTLTLKLIMCLAAKNCV